MVLQQPSTRNTQTFDTQLEALFYSFDADSNGSIDQGEFESAIDELGFALSKERVGELFTEFDADNSGTIEWDEFLSIFKVLEKMKANQAVDGKAKECRNKGVVKDARKIETCMVEADR